MTEYIFGGGGKPEPSSKTKKSKASNKNKDKDKDSNKKQALAIKEVIKKPTIQEPQVSIPDEIKREYKFPLDFVEYLEKKHIPKKFIPEIENIFQVSNCQSNGPKYDVLTFQKKEELNQKFFKESTDAITAIIGQEDDLYVGLAKGIVKKYSCKNETETCSFTDNSIDNLQICKIIMCIDVSSDGNFLAVGYTKGFVSLWDMRNNKNKLLKFVDKAQVSTILSIKFLVTSTNQQELISADADGNVLLYTFTKKLMITLVTSQYLLKDPTPVFVMDIFTPTAEQKELSPSFQTDCVFGAFGSINKVLVILLKPNIKKLLKMENPAYGNSREIPDVSFGIGNEPMKNRSQYIMKALDRQNLSVMIAISWNTVISVYKINLDDLTISAQAIGYYKNDNYQILRMGFLDTSEIFFLDSLKKIKILHTSFMNPQLTLDDKKSRRSNDVVSLIDEGKTIDADTICQKLIFDPLDTKSTQGKETYNNFLSAKGKKIFFLCKKSFYYGILLTWEESIKALKDKNMWEDAIFLAVNIHEGLITTLPNIPLDEDQRKKELGKMTQDMLCQYVKNVMYKIRSEKNWEENIKKCINMCIEICIQINAIDFLFTKIKPEFVKYDEMFIHLLEPFILLSRFYKFDIAKEMIDVFLDYYTEKAQIILLIQILFNLNPKSINIPSVQNYMIKNNWYTLMLYLDSKNRHYFSSIDKMFDKLQGFKDISDADFISYSNCLRKMHINDVLISKPYMTHKVLWYCNYCLSQKIFPDDSLIDDKDFDELVIQILNKLLIEGVFFEFINYDSYSFLQILSRFFIEEKLVTIIESNNEQDKNLFSDKSKSVAKSGIEISSLSITEILIEYVIQTTTLLESILIKQDLNLFIGVCFTNKMRLNKPRAIEAGCNLLSFYKTVKEQSAGNSVFDKFNTHGLRAENPFYIQELTDLLLIIIDFLEDEMKINQFLSISESTPLVIIRIKLFLKLNNYNDAFEEVIQYRNESFLGKKKVFEWIYANLRETKPNEKTHKRLLSAILDKFEILARFSIDDTMAIVNDWFHEDESSVIHKLDSNKEVQFELIEILLKTKSEDKIISEGDKKIREYTDILLLHIKLLIHLNRKDQVLKNLKMRNSYPLDDVLSVCLEHKVNDAAIDIYISTGNNKDAMIIGLEDLSKALNELKDFSLKQLSYNDKDDKWLELIQMASKEKKKCIHICSQTSQTTSSNENEVLWFSLFNELYNALNQVNQSSDKDNQYINDMKKLLTDDLDSLLKEMCNYLQIKRIIENVTKNYQNAEFKQFKAFLNSMLSTFSHLTNMFHSTKHLLSNRIKFNLIDYKRENAKGVKYCMRTCDICHLTFYGGDEAIAFKCGHIAHHSPFCVIEERNMSVCKICRKNEIEDCGSSKGEKYSSSSRVRSGNASNGNDNIQKKSNAAAADMIRIQEKKALKRLKEIDEHLIEQGGMIIKKDGLY